LNTVVECNEFQADIDTTKRPATKAYETFSSLDRSKEKNIHKDLSQNEKDWK